jgi:hypothetical protein
MKIVKKRTRKKLKYAKLTKKNKLLKKSKKNTKKILRGGVRLRMPKRLKKMGRSLKKYASKALKRKSTAEKAAAKATKKARKEAKSKAKAEAKEAKKEEKKKAKADAKEAKKAEKEAKKNKSKEVNDGKPTLTLSGDIPGKETSTEGSTNKNPSKLRRAVNFTAKGLKYAGKGTYYAGKGLITTGRVANKVLFGTSSKSGSTPKLQKNLGTQDMLMQMMIAQQMQQKTGEQIKTIERDPKFTKEDKAKLEIQRIRNDRKIMELEDKLKKEGIDIPKDLNATNTKLQELQLEEKGLMKEAFEDKYIIIDKKLQNSINNYDGNIINGIIHYCHRNRKKCGGEDALKSENTFEEYVKFLKKNNIITEKSEPNT